MCILHSFILRLRYQKLLDYCNENKLSWNKSHRLIVKNKIFGSNPCPYPNLNGKIWKIMLIFMGFLIRPNLKQLLVVCKSSLGRGNEYYLLSFTFWIFDSCVRGGSFCEIVLLQIC